MNQTDTFAKSVTAVKAAYTCKLLRLLPDRRIVRMVMELVGNHSPTLATGNNKWSSLRRLKKGVPKGSTLAPFSSAFMICQPPSPESMYTPTT